MSASPQHRVGLFVTCLADLFRPSVAFSSIALLERAGCIVEVPELQTCCGQPGYNSGAIDETRPLARKVIECFADYPYVVVPSGSCAGMLKHHYPRLFAEYPDWHGRAQDLARRTWEVTSFLVEVMDYTPAQADTGDRTVTYHDSCAGLRELGIKQQPRKLLERAGVQVTEMQGTEVCCGFGGSTEVCCGFGGTFCAKMPQLSEKMVSDKIGHANDAGADVLVGGDLGCLMNIAGRASRQDTPLEVRHVVEILNDQLDGPSIGEGS